MTCIFKPENHHPDFTMIISHKHRFIFIKTKKTAGTSIEIALARYCGDDDIITSFGKASEKIRRELKIRKPQNYFLPLDSYNAIDWFRLLFGNRKKFRSHTTASQLKSLINDDIWNNYFKFCFVRNPWDRVISLYYSGGKPEMSLSEYINRGIPFSRKKQNFPIYTINGKIAVDRVFFYENLEEELIEVAKLIGLPGQLSLPSAKGHFRSDRRPYHEVLSVTDAAKIATNYSCEIKLFNYTFQQDVERQSSAKLT